MTNIIPVILSGGSGTRLWPLSTDARPKQFLALAAERSMFAETLARCADRGRFSAPIIIGGERHGDLMAQEVADDPAARILLEPCARNTAPAIALAAIAARQAGASDAVMLVMSSDHVITDLDAFLRAVDCALPAASAGWLVSFGIEPTGPETGFGYLEMGGDLPAAPGVRAAVRFIEKPPREAAEAMLAAGSHVWNAGIFLFRADRLLEELATHAPAMADACTAAMAKAMHDGPFIRPDASAFAASPSDSIDYAVMERAAKVAIVPVSCGWSDVGSWDALAGIGAGDANGNRFTGDVLALDSHDNLVRADGLKISLAGVQNLIVVANGDELLIMPRGRSQDVKAIVAARKTA